MQTPSGIFKDISSESRAEIRHYLYFGSTKVPIKILGPDPLVFFHSFYKKDNKMSMWNRKMWSQHRLKAKTFHTKAPPSETIIFKVFFRDKNIVLFNIDFNFEKDSKFVSKANQK